MTKELIDNKHFPHTVRKISNNQLYSNCIGFNDWLVKKQIPYCELVRTSPGQHRFSFCSREDRDIFLLEFLGDFQIEKELQKSI
jgi:hypothetical protein